MKQIRPIREPLGKVLLFLLNKIKFTDTIRPMLPWRQAKKAGHQTIFVHRNLTYKAQKHLYRDILLHIFFLQNLGRPERHYI